MIDGCAADFELERGRDAVARLQPPAGQRLRVAVQVDETRRDDESADVDRHRPVELVAESGNAPTVDADVAPSVEPSLGIEHPPTGQDQIVRHRALLSANTTFTFRWRLPEVVEATGVELADLAGVFVGYVVH